MLFAAVHESVIGTKLTIAALQQFGRYWTNNGQREAPGLNGSAANDPKRASVPNDKIYITVMGQIDFCFILCNDNPVRALNPELELSVCL
jgi:hypothetical protein